MRRLLCAAYFVEVGLALVVLPWTIFWDYNYLFDLVPLIRPWIQSSYARGAVSGLGLLNVALGLAEMSAVVGRLARPAANRQWHVRLRPPLLCLVTDRHRLGARLGLPPNAESTIDALLTQVTAAGAAGVSLIQVREPDLPAGALVGLVRAIRARVAAQDTLVVVNDRLDIALASRADGVHLKSSSVAVGEAARLAPPPCLIGRSVHSLPEIARGVARGADYLIVGTVLPTGRSRLGGKRWGWQVWRRRCMPPRRCRCSALAASVRTRPPTSHARARPVWLPSTAFLPSDPAKIADTVHEAVRRMRMAFDSTLPPSLT